MGQSKLNISISVIDLDKKERRGQVGKGMIFDKMVREDPYGKES